MADLVEETGTSPGLILQWAKQALEGLEQTFSRETHRPRKVLHREILEKEDRIRKLESVVRELSTENLTLKKAWGSLTGAHVSPETTEEVLKTVLFLKKTPGFPVRKSPEVLGLLSRTYHRWGVTQGNGLAGPIGECGFFLSIYSTPRLPGRGRRFPIWRSNRDG
ncbi:MAG: hypothetical protein VST70_00850 [Nitrospirota bacterium]|nr:hypothetical protein [Nitrospirota bacterium]